MKRKNNVYKYRDMKHNLFPCTCARNEFENFLLY